MTELFPTAVRHCHIMGVDVSSGLFARSHILYSWSPQPHALTRTHRRDSSLKTAMEMWRALESNTRSIFTGGRLFSFKDLLKVSVFSFFFVGSVTFSVSGNVDEELELG